MVYCDAELADKLDNKTDLGSRMRLRLLNQIPLVMAMPSMTAPAITMLAIVPFPIEDLLELDGEKGDVALFEAEGVGGVTESVDDESAVVDDKTTVCGPCDVEDIEDISTDDVG